MQVAGRLVVPRRDLKKLPSFLKTRQLSGDVSANVDIDGALADPDVRFSLETANFASALGGGMKPLDAKISGRYLEGEAKVDVDVAAAQKQLLVGEVHLQGRVRDFLQPPDPEGPPWRASTRMRLSDFPLETVEFFSDFQMKGFASGELTIDDVHDNARAKIEIAFRDLALGEAKFPRGSARAAFDGHLLRARVRLDQTDGFVQTDGEVGMSWGRRAAPETTTDVPAFVTLRAGRFRAAALLPFLSSELTELDGRIDPDARIDVKQGGSPPNMKGTVTLNDGLVQLARVGERFTVSTSRSS
jgi:hypothetical protein